MKFFSRSRNLFLLSVFVPLWLTLGRGLLGSAGWLTFLMVMTVLPLLLPTLITILYTLRADVRESGYLKPAEAVALWALHGTFILFGFFVVDGGDTEESAGSVLTRLLGSEWSENSGYIASVLLVFGLFLALLVVKDGIVARRRLKQKVKD